MRAITLGAALLCGLAVSTPLSADEAPQRKHGLWEMRMQSEGAPAGLGPMQICVDETNADPRQPPAGAPKQDCDKSTVTKDGDKTVVHMLCRMGKGTVTSDATVTGDLNSAYHTEIRSQFDPPMHGRKESQMMVDAKWLGPCAPGQKAGVVGAPNMQEIMKLKARPTPQ